MIWLGLAVVIVAVAAALLLWVLAEARGIATQAKRALAAGALVEQRTRVLQAIPTVNLGLRGAVATVMAIHGQADALAGALEESEEVK